jgi:hypothetical protein
VKAGDRLADLGELLAQWAEVVAQERDVRRELVLHPRQDADALLEVVEVAAVLGQLAQALGQRVQVVERLSNGPRREREQIEAGEGYPSSSSCPPPASRRASSSSRLTVSV